MLQLKRVAVLLLFLALSTAMATAGPLTFQTLDAPLPLGGSTTLFGINDAGEIVGRAGIQAVVYTKGSFAPFSLPGAFLTFVNGVNNAGQIVGGYVASGGPTQGNAFVYTNGSVTAIAVGALSTTGLGINNLGQVVGSYVDTLGGNNLGFLDTGGVITTITPSGAIQTFATGINDAGEIVGYSIDSSGTASGFVDTGSMITTLNVPGATETFLNGINTAGQIVGSYEDSGFNNYGFVYTGGTFVTFDVSPGAETAAQGINSAGQIVGFYGAFEGFVATPTTVPVPETNSLLLLGTGLVGLLSINHVRRRRNVRMLCPRARATALLSFLKPAQKLLRPGHEDGIVTLESTLPFSNQAHISQMPHPFRPA